MSTYRCCYRACVCCYSSERQLPGASDKFLTNYVRRRLSAKGDLSAEAELGDVQRLARQAVRDVREAIAGDHAPSVDAELAMAEPATFDFVVNLKSAAALGLALPQTLLAGAEKI